MLNKEEKDKAETVAAWLFGYGYNDVYPRFYYYAVLDPSYKAKAINSKVDLNGNNLFTCFILSHFDSARDSTWFAKSMMYYEQFKTADGRFIFPKTMIAEQKDGDHMNIGESKRDKYTEILSTYWMERILNNCEGGLYNGEHS